MKRKELFKYDVIMISCEFTISRITSDLLMKVSRFGSGIYVSQRDEGLEPRRRYCEGRQYVFTCLLLMYPKIDSPLGIIHSIDFHRLILDEAHSIKVSDLTIQLLLFTKAYSFFVATYDQRCSCMFCIEIYVQMVPFWNASSESYWRVLFSASISRSSSVRLLFLQNVSMPGASLVSRCREKMHTLQSQVCMIVPSTSAY